MPLITRSTLPPGGWLFDQKYGENRVKHFAGMGPFADFVKEVADFRRGNGLERATEEETGDDVDEFQCARLGFDPRFTRKKKLSMFSTLPSSPRHLFQVAGHAAASVSRTLAGTRVLRDWFGDGAVPVARDLAQKRADICRSCVKNVESHGVMKLTSAIATAIAEQIEAKHQMQLTVDHEEELHVCSVCLCTLVLKVHTPIEHIVAHTSFMDEFPNPPCWIPAEAAQLKQLTPA